MADDDEPQLPVGPDEGDTIMMLEGQEWIPRNVEMVSDAFFKIEGYTDEIPLQDAYGTLWKYSTDLVDTANWRQVDLIVAALDATCSGTIQIRDFIQIIDGRELSGMFGEKVADKWNYWKITGGRGKHAVYALTAEGKEHATHLRDTTDGYAEYATVMMNIVAGAMVSGVGDDANSYDDANSTHTLSPGSSKFVGPAAVGASSKKRGLAVTECPSEGWNAIKEMAEDFIQKVESSYDSQGCANVRARVQELFVNKYPSGINIDNMLDDDEYQSIASDRALFMRQAILEDQERRSSSVRQLYAETCASIKRLSAAIREE